MDLETLREVAESLSIEEFARKYRGFFLARTGEPIDIPSGVFTVIREFEHDSRPAAPTWQIIRVMKAVSNARSAEPISIGRDRNCDIVLRDSSASKIHAYLRLNDQDDRLELIDNGSSNGTRVDGRRIAKDGTETVRVGAVLDFGGVSVLLLNAAGLYALARKR